MRKMGWLAVVLALAGVGFAQGRAGAKPNLTGVWKLNVAASDFGDVPPPTRQSEVVTQAGDEFAIAITMEREEMKQNYTLRFQAGGAEMPLAEGSFPEEAPFRILGVKGAWQGSVLVVTERVSFQGAEGMLTANYSLSTDGKVLRKTSHVVMDAGTLDTKTVYDKQ
ncbi:MAG TPA: hypothetical protein VIX42_12625 [Edaphobacter sp.]